MRVGVGDVGHRGAWLRQCRRAGVVADAAIPLKLPRLCARSHPCFPGDVDTALKKRLEQEKLFPEVQRLFDLNAWQMFLAVNWPTNGQGQPAASLTDVASGEPHWTLWQTSSQIYRADGKRPAACDASASSAPPSAPAPLAQPQAPLLRDLPPPQRRQDARPRSAAA